MALVYTIDRLLTKELSAWWCELRVGQVQAMRECAVCSDSEVIQSCLILCDPMDCSLPGSSVRGIFQAIVLEWIAI